MLKLYKATAIASTLVAVFACFISIVCELSQFPHVLLIQNYAVGISCSLIVVIITTLLQYLHEHKNVFDAYCSSLRNLIFNISTVFYSGEGELSDGYYDYIYEQIDSAFELFKISARDLCWFSRKKKKLQADVFKYYIRLWLAFDQPRFESKKACIIALENSPHYDSLIKACSAILPEGSAKDLFEAKYKHLNRESNGDVYD